MESWLYQSLALLATAPWWLLLARHAWRAIDHVRENAGDPRGPRAPNALALERARETWGHERFVTGRHPRRLTNLRWATGRRVDGAPRRALPAPRGFRSLT